MKRLRNLSWLLLPLLVWGCTSFSTHVFRTEQVLTTAAYGAYIGYTSAIPQLHLTAAESNSVKQARLRFATSVAVVELWRQAYETNATLKPQVEAALAATEQNASNLVWLINYIKNERQP